MLRSRRGISDCCAINSLLRKIRSCCLEMCCKKGALKNFAKFAGKHLYWSLFFNKAAELRPTTSLKKTDTGVFL